MRWPPFITRVVEVDPIIDRLQQLESAMSAQSEAFANLSASIDGVVERVNADVTHLRELLDAALATNPDQSDEIARLKAEADTVVDSLWGATARLNAIDPDAEFPVVPDA